jgi:hypothetical protein
MTTPEPDDHATPQDRRTITADRSWMLWTAIGIGGIWVAVLLLSLLAPDLVSGSEQQHFPVAAAMLTALAGGAGLSGGRVGAGGWAGRPRPSGGVACRAGAAERDQGDSQGDGQPGRSQPVPGSASCRHGPNRPLLRLHSRPARADHLTALSLGFNPLVIVWV